MVELADTIHSKCIEEIRVGSNPSIGTKLFSRINQMSDIDFGYIDRATGQTFQGYIASDGSMKYRRDDEEVTINNWVELPKWARFSDFLQKECMGRNVRLSFNINKGWIRETTFFTITGKRKDVIPLWNYIQECLENY